MRSYNPLRHGTFLISLDLTESQRFWLKVDGDGAVDECWLWVGSVTSNGYGSFRSDDKGHCAHRYAYEDLIGPIPDGLHLDHLCKVRTCVNPWHLDPVTVAVNVGRADPAQKTHCVHGHELSGPNLYIHAVNGRRGCRTCRIAQAAASNARRRERELTASLWSAA